MAELSQTFKDYSAEVSTTSVYVDDAILPADQTTLLNAINGVSSGNPQKTTLSVVTRISNLPPADQQAQREQKLLVRYEDNVTLEIGTFTVPCIDLAQATLLPNSDFVDLTVGGMPALVTALQSFARSKQGNGITVINAQYVGRNS